MTLSVTDEPPLGLVNQQITDFDDKLSEMTKNYWSNARLEIEQFESFMIRAVENDEKLRKKFKLTNCRPN